MYVVGLFIMYMCLCVCVCVFVCLCVYVFLYEDISLYLESRHIHPVALVGAV